MDTRHVERSLWYGKGTGVLLVFLLLVCSQVGRATPVTVQADLSTSGIYLGESVHLDVRIQGLRDPEPPVIEHPDLDITSEGGQSFNNSSITIINGRTARQEDFGYVARYRLRPRRTGVFHIPAVAVSHEGHTYRSQPLTLVVQEPVAQDYLLVEVHTDKSTYVLGERITLSLDLSLRKVTRDDKELDVDPFFSKQPPHLQIPWFEGLGEWKTTELETFVQPFLGQSRPGFFINDYYDQRSFFRSERLAFTLPRHSTTRARATGTWGYFTYRLQKVFRPLRAGVQTIPPVLVKATLPTQVDARGRALQTQEVVASSQPITVEVQAVPSAGQPVSFSGGIGRFRLDVDATPTALKVGDPLTLTVTVQRQGDSLLETVQPLRLQDQPALVQDFKIHTDPPAVHTTAEAKTFTYTLRPRHADVRAVPSLDMAYYDPEHGNFRIAQSDPIPVHVQNAATLAASDVIVAAEARPKSKLGQQLAAGLLANYSGPEVLRSQSAELRLTPLLGGLVVLPPVAFMCTMLGRQWRRRRHPGRQRSRKAARTALTAFQDLKKQQTAGDVAICEGVYRALTGYISDKMELTHAGLTADDVTQHLQNRKVEQELIDQAVALFHLCDSARYAPGTLAVAQLTGVIEEAEALVQRLEAHASWR